LCVRHKKKKKAKKMGDEKMATVPYQQHSNAAALGSQPMSYYAAPGAAAEHAPQPYGGVAQPYQVHGASNIPDRKPLAVAGTDRASSLAIGERDRDGVASTQNSILRDGLERREEKLSEREREIERMERRAEELDARERALVEREGRMSRGA
jgi:hypothetical protein